MRDSVETANTRQAVHVNPNRDVRWNELVRQHSNAAPAHVAAWGRMLKRAFPNLDPVYLGIEEGKNLCAGLSLFHARSWLTGSRLISLPFATVADPLVDTPLQLQTLLKAAKKEAVRLGAHHIELRCTTTAPIARECGLTPTRRFKLHTMRLDRDPEQLLKKFDRSCVRQQINKSIKAGLDFFPAGGEEELSTFYRLYVMTRKRLRLPPLPWDLFDALFRELGPTGNAEVLLAFKDGMAVGGLFTLRHGRRTSFEHVGVDPEVRGIPIFHFLYWNAIVRAYTQNCREIDFGRTAKSNAGLMKFKQRWYTEESDIIHFEIPTKAKKSRQPESAPDSTEGFRYRALQKACELAPAPALIQLGRFCYRHYM